MPLATREKQALMVGAVGLGAVMLARAWRRRDPYEFTSKSVVITGGSRGLGLVMARELADEGARVTLIARDEDELARAADDIRTRQPFAEVLTVVADIRRRYDTERAIAQVIDRYGRVDVLINNAGIIQVGPLDHMKLADYEDAMATHFWGPLYMVVAALPHMRRQSEGRIVNISSIGGRIAVPHLAPYSVSKFALVGLSDAVRAEVARHGVRVTTVSPGLMRTGSPIQAQFKGQQDQEFTWFAIADAIPGMSIGAERAARQIVDACRNGDPELTIGLPAKAAVAVSALAPTVFAGVTAAVVRCLPGPAGASGDRLKRGREARSPWAPSMVTKLSDRAAMANNEV